MKGPVAIVRRLTATALPPSSGRHMDSSFLTSIAPFILIVPIFYFLMIRPQQQRMKQHREMLENVRRGDTVVTAGGIVGRGGKGPQKEDPEITVEIADDVVVRILKSTLTEVRAKGQPVEASAKADKNEKSDKS